MVLVLTVIAVAAVLGMSLLASASVRSRTAGNAVMAARADRLAESGVNLGLYLLRNPSLAGTLASTGSYATTGLSLGNPADGTFDLSITRRSTAQGDVFDIVTTGTAGSSTSETVATHRLAATARTLKRFLLTDSATVNANLTIGSTSSYRMGTGTVPVPGYAAGSISAAGALVINSGATVSGPAKATGVSPIGAVPDGLTLPGPDRIAPDWFEVKPYGPTYTHNGSTYSAQILVGPLNSSPAATDPATNPLGIYYSPVDLAALTTPAGPASIGINGSLVIAGRLSVGAVGNGSVRTLTITPTPGSPGLVVARDLNIAGPNKRLTVNGLLYTRDGITGNGAATSGTLLTINGAWLSITGPSYSGAIQAVHPLFQGRIYATYVPENVNVADFTTVTNQATTGIALTSFAPMP